MMPVLRNAAMSATAIGLVLFAASCAGEDERLVVFAASSLTDAFGRIEAEYEAAHPGVDVVVSFGGSSSLAAQLADGAPADVFAAANPEQMDRVLAERPARPMLFALNSMVVAVEAGNPLGIAGLDALEDGLLVVLAAPEVPAGAYANEILDCAGVEVDAASYEPSVRSVATKVGLGEADAGLVYRTDIDDRIEAVAIDDDCNVRARYPIAALSADAESHGFVDFVLGDQGRAALTVDGFEVP